MTFTRKSNASGIGVSLHRNYLDNRFVYVVLSARAGGMTIGVDFNPGGTSNFSDIDCDMDREGRVVEPRLDVTAMAAELTRTLTLVHSGRLRELPDYRFLPDQVLQLRHVALTGAGEPTLAAEFPEALLAVIHVRALGGFPFFKFVLLTNGTGLDRPGVRQSLRHLTKADEVWVELDGGTEAYVNRVHQTHLSLEKILSNILRLGRERPVVIQSLFQAIDGEGPALQEIERFGQRLLALKKAGAQIPVVEISSAASPVEDAHYSHLPLKDLSRIAQRVRQVARLKAEVF
jgi:wyosine [tRNA(Phe)-imidazoG37] synthetase (radical SAM superfamily)